MSQSPVAADREEHELSHHPQPRQYVFIGVVLSIITAVEVAIYYFNIADAALITFLIIFSILKFVLVVAFFMHLRFDSKLFRYVFVAGLATAFTVFMIVLVIFFIAGGGPAPEVTG